MPLREWVPRLIAAALGTVAVAAARPRGPRPAGDEAGAAGFSTARAEQHLYAIATRPRPSGSPAAADTRDYLGKELADLGFQVEVQETVSANGAGRAPYGLRYLGAGVVRNVIATIPGTDSTGGVLLMTHYDTVGQGPGASDAGVPLAALLETARAIAAGPRPRNDIVFLITDGEEAGLLGSTAFFTEHPLGACVGVVLNFEARGTTGPVLMFETGFGNGPIIAELARAGVPVHASSLFDAVYRRLPNATDFGPAKQRGLPGLNFANVRGFARYHGPADDIAHADRRTLTHHGRLALRLALRLGDADLGSVQGDDAVFFSTAGGRLVRYPYRVAAGLGLLAAATGAAGVWRWSREVDAPARKLGGSVAALSARTVAAGALGTGYTALIGARNHEFRRSGDVYDSADVYAGIAALTVAAAMAGAASKPADAQRRLAGAAVPLAAAAAWSGLGAPAGSYLPAWPALGAAAALLARGRGVSAAAAGLPAVSLLIPMSRLLFDGLTPRLAGSGAAVLHLAVELLMPAVAELPRRARYGFAAAALTAAVAIAVNRLRTRPADPGRPRPTSLMYLLNADEARACWASTAPRVDEWSGHFLGRSPQRGQLPDFFPGWRRMFLHAPAVPLALVPPQIEVGQPCAVPGGRWRVELAIRSPRGARQISLAVPDARIIEWAVDGRRNGQPEPGDEPWELWLHAVPEGGLHVTLEISGVMPLRLRVADRSDGLPPELRAEQFADGTEPAGYGPAAALDAETWADATFVSRWLTIPAPETRREE